MLDREDKLWMILFVVMILLLPTVFLYMVSDKKSNKEIKCDRLGGVVIKISNGWKCIDTKVLV
jgi:hypothetical protein